MAKLEPEHIQFASDMWNDMASASEIADAIWKEFEIDVGPQAIQFRAMQNRDLFPARTEEQRREMIERGMRKSIERDPDAYARMAKTRAARRKNTDTPRADTEEFWNA